MSTADGLPGAVRDEAGGEGLTHRALGMMPDAVQLSLLRGQDDGRIDAGGIRQLRTGPGRRPGSRNKRNEKTAKLIVQRYGDPLDALGNFASMPLEDAVAFVRHADDPDRDGELARIEGMLVRFGGQLSKTVADKLGSALAKYLDRKVISAIDVVTMQVRVQQDLMTYVHGRQPVSVEVREKTDAVIIIPGINAPLGVSQETIQEAVNARGLDAIDFEQMKLTGPVEDAEFADVAGDEP